MKIKRKILSSEQELLAAAADVVVRLLHEAIEQNGSASFVLSGGSTPKGLYTLLATQLKTSVDWRKVHFFWGDERCVPPDHPDSNFNMANEAFFKHMHMPETNIHRIRAELPAIDAAGKYEAEMRRVLGLKQGEFPRFDVLLLGMGDDGHTASLFPGTAALDEQSRLVVANHVPKLDADRVTITLPVINHARNVVFLIAGSGKVDVLKEVLEGPPDRYPSQRVNPRGTVHWFIESSAAANLTEHS